MHLSMQLYSWGTRTMKYNIIYADPPWDYPKSGSKKSSRGLAKSFYNTMPTDEIMNMDIQSICSENCYLFLWTTSPKLPEALEVMKAWGFEYFNVIFTWIKTNKISDSLFWGMGNTTRANAEYVLLGRKGKLDRMNAGVHSVIMSKIEKHSKKPDEVRNRIDTLYGDIPRIELFARERHVGWDSWGDEL